MPSKKSGGARATKKKHSERDARRRRAAPAAPTPASAAPESAEDEIRDAGTERTRARWNEKEWLERYAALRLPPKDPDAAHEWLGKISQLLVAEAGSDPGPPPEQRREQMGRLIGVAVKAAEPAKLSAKLALYEKALQELRANAASVHSGAHGRARSSTPLS
jgi:hypothetical protein